MMGVYMKIEKVTLIQLLGTMILFLIVIRSDQSPTNSGINIFISVRQVFFS